MPESEPRIDMGGNGRCSFDTLTWKQVEEYLQSDKRIVIPLGATEEHADLSLCTDTLVVERLAMIVCQRVGVLVSPALPFGCSAFSIRFPGSISLRTSTMCSIIEDIVSCLYRQGFRRMIFLTGHGGNEVITGVLSECQLDRPGLTVYYRTTGDWTREQIRMVEREQNLPASEHASWVEDLPFTRINKPEHGCVLPPTDPDFPIFPLNPRIARERLGGGVIAGARSLGHETSMGLFYSSVEGFEAFLRSVPAEEATV